MAGEAGPEGSRGPGADPAATGWALAVDFGTTFTAAAAVRAFGEPRVLRLEPRDDRMPSGVFVEADGRLLAGHEAERAYLTAPDFYEPTPKEWVRSVDTVVRKGALSVPVSRMLATVLSRVLSRARTEHGGTEPALVCLTHPAEWTRSSDAEEGPRLAVLRAAAAEAGAARVEFMPEPVAAAVWLLSDPACSVDVGQHVAVYDYGGGTFDAAVLRRTTDGFVQIGNPRGAELGGQRIDQRIIAHLGRGEVGRLPGWQQLMTPTSDEWLERAQELAHAVEEAKCTLSDETEARIRIPGLGRRVTLNLDELNELVREDVEKTVSVLAATIREAELRPGDLEAVYLVGGSSRMRLVNQRVMAGLGLRRSPVSWGDPKMAVVLGAARWLSTRLGATARQAPAAAAEEMVERWLSMRRGASARPATQPPPAQPPPAPTQPAQPPATPPASASTPPAPPPRPAPPQPAPSQPAPPPAAQPRPATSAPATPARPTAPAPGTPARRPFATRLRLEAPLTSLARAAMGRRKPVVAAQRETRIIVGDGSTVGTVVHALNIRDFATQRTTQSLAGELWRSAKAKGQRVTAVVDLPVCGRDAGAEWWSEVPVPGRPPLRLVHRCIAITGRALLLIAAERSIALLDSVRILGVRREHTRLFIDGFGGGRAVERVRVSSSGHVVIAERCTWGLDADPAGRSEQFGLLRAGWSPLVRVSPSFLGEALPEETDPSQPITVVDSRPDPVSYLGDRRAKVRELQVGEGDKATWAWWWIGEVDGDTVSVYAPRSTRVPLAEAEALIRLVQLAPA